MFGNSFSSPTVEAMEGRAEEMIQIRTQICNHCGHELRTEAIPVPAHFFRYDFVPSSREAIDIAAVLEVESHELCRYDGEIAAIALLKERLEEGRARLHARIEQRRAVLSPVRRVPSEIWQMIFSWVCLSEAYSLTFRDKYALSRNAHSSWSASIRRPISIPYPCMLSSICRAWRSIAHSTPALWCSICINLDGMVSDLRPPLISVLERSSGRPLKISITTLSKSGRDVFRDNGQASESFSPPQYNILHLLLSEMSRCEDLQLVINRRWEPSCIPHFDLPILKAFRTNIVPCMHTGTFHSTHWLWEKIMGTQSLTDLVVPRVPPFALIPQLHHLDIEGVPFMDDWKLPRLLRTASLLESLAIRHLSIGNMTLDPPVHLAHLRHFSLVIQDPYNEPPVYSSFFDALTLPSLKSFRMKCTINQGIDPSHWPHHAFLAFLQRCSNSLEKFAMEIAAPHSTISNIAFPVPEYVSTLVNLTHLCLKRQVDEDVGPALDFISYLTSNPRLVPRLSELVITLTHSEDIIQQSPSIADHLLKFAESRAQDETSVGGGPQFVAFALTNRGFTWDSSFSSSWDPLEDSVDLAERTRNLRFRNIKCALGFSSRIFDHHSDPSLQWWEEDLRKAA
ncbi:hypothetical protein AAF712_007302 [Marasmius tenuissimus]|uniref:F-box domain-containing protein n=1 Tax=Marasmius tenuissimus TaxID=585030 RepID=A0ABR2ZVA7_9AGAR|nr:hypothetical protein PM082_013875 [Marasmius tenuissimus]